ncbi:MAG: hypothetical protein ACYTG0_14970 [Planctomycetota bacterium]|jgi:hypothetical protein
MRTLTQITLIGMFTVVALGVSSAWAGEPPPKTLFEAWARSQATLKSADANMMKAQTSWITAVANVRKAAVDTAKILQEVRSMDLDNQVKTTDIFFKKRERREQYVSANPRARLGLETYVKVSNASRPARLTQYQFDPDRGTIYWPVLLQGPEFEDQRAELQALFALNSSKGQESGLDFQHKVDGVARNMREMLKRRVRQVSQMEYIESKKFLMSLAYEARSVPQLEGIAAK